MKKGQAEELDKMMSCFHIGPYNLCFHDFGYGFSTYERTIPIPIHTGKNILYVKKNYYG